MKHLLVLALAIGFAVVPACVCGGEGASENPSSNPLPLSSAARPRGRVKLMRNLPIVPRSSISAAAPAAPSAPASAQ